MFTRQKEILLLKMEYQEAEVSFFKDFIFYFAKKLVTQSFLFEDKITITLF